MKQLPLEGIRVLDFTWILAGPFATAMMADFGAEVIKVQSHKISSGTEQNDSYYFAALNRNKKSITLNMNQPEAVEIVLKLAEKSDVVIQNFTPRVMENWGLAYEAFCRANPSIIMVNLSGFGNKGPWRDCAALADTIESLSGLVQPSGNEQPLLTGYPYSDIVSGLFTFIATLSALEQRRQTGQGRNIDISELEAMCSLLGSSILEHATCSSMPEQIDAAPYGCYKCRGNDRWCVISVHTDEQWQKLRLAMGDPAWAGKPEFSTTAKRIRNNKLLDKYIGHWTGTKPAKTIMRLLQSNGIACSPVNNARDLANDPQLKSRDFFKNYLHPSLGNIVYSPTPIKMSLTPPSFIKPPPLLGEDNEYVFKELLGMDNKQIEEYIGKSIIY